MNRLFFILAALILVSCAGTPKINFDQTSHDFGIVEPESELVHVFGFSNTGEATLIVQKVRAG
ncbi:MAG: hypothetical protein CVV44_16640 [Spirochaetae bacterium HGW-Spirochaetae-1]|jgi:hypothetical protein|nr:MAG: hypothetical protein CVV44_16640 [Spirochaetae bacterium HGW-Spirochaetae-1]